MARSRSEAFLRERIRRRATLPPGAWFACVGALHVASCSVGRIDSGMRIEEETCVLDTCVASAEADGVACCVAAHGLGLKGDAAEALARSCEGDECDGSNYLTEAAAVCVAQVCGLSAGIGSCSGRFEFGTSGGSWLVSNDEEECEPDANLCGGGQFIEVDAGTGSCGDGGSWSN